MPYFASQVTFSKFTHLFWADPAKQTYKTTKFNMPHDRLWKGIGFLTYITVVMEIEEVPKFNDRKVIWAFPLNICLKFSNMQYKMYLNIFFEFKAQHGVKIFYKDMRLSSLEFKHFLSFLCKINGNSALYTRLWEHVVYCMCWDFLN